MQYFGSIEIKFVAANANIDPSIYENIIIIPLDIISLIG
jgi:hypothetical protein